MINDEGVCPSRMDDDFKSLFLDTRSVREERERERERERENNPRK
jgi:hypothetical protein